MLWLIGVLACNNKEQEQQSGADLLKDYQSALCEWYSDRDCSLEITNCGQPVTQFSDWAQCMNAQNNRTSLCGQLPSRIEEQPTDIQECIALLQTQECLTESICGSDEHLLFEGVCGNVEELILQECTPF